jgi:hypothetical protein
MRQVENMVIRTGSDGWGLCVKKYYW